jgi:proteasome lid subunit RPN8/RPN11
VVEPEDLVTAVREARERSLVVLGYYHSHPEGPALPSSEDRRWAWPEASYLIVARAGGKLEARSWRLAGTDFVEEPVTAARDRVTR